MDGWDGFLAFPENSGATIKIAPLLTEHCHGEKIRMPNLLSSFSSATCYNFSKTTQKWKKAV